MGGPVSSATKLARPLEAAAELAASIANDVNAPAQYVADNVSFLRRAFDKLLPLLEAEDALAAAVRAGTAATPALEAVDTARAAARLDYLTRHVPRAVEQSLHGLSQISASMRALKELSRPSGSDAQPSDINELIEAASILAKNDWQHVAELQLDFDWDLPPVHVRRADFSQLVLTVISNAGRSVGASLSLNDARKGSIVVATRAVENDVQVRISDSTGASCLLSLPLASP